MLELNQIHLGDCLELMKEIEDKSVDLVLTDPPYGLNYNNGMDLAGQWESVFGGDLSNNGISREILGDGEEEALELFTNFLYEAKRVLKKGACCCCCCGGGGGKKPLFAKWTLLMDEIIGFNHAVVWDKGGLGMGIHWRRSYEFMLIAQDGNTFHRWNGDNKVNNILRQGRFNKIIPNSKQHTTEKPVKLFKYFIQLLSNECDTILDPFSGSGTTAIACLELNRNFICIEKDPKYWELSVKRVNDYKSQMKMEFEK
jgi:DNA modification methylase